MNKFRRVITLSLLLAVLGVSANLYAKDLKIIVKTYNDDLRSGSKINLELQTTYGNFRYYNLNNGIGMGAHSKKYFTIHVPDYLAAEDYFGGSIWYQSGSCFACSQDNWSMSSLVVVTDNGMPLLYKGSHRFTGGSPNTIIPYPEY